MNVSKVIETMIGFLQKMPCRDDNVLLGDNIEMVTRLFQKLIEAAGQFSLIIKFEKAEFIKLTEDLRDS